jgi:hypothetical protein
MLAGCPTSSTSLIAVTSPKGEWMKQAMYEDPLKLGGGIHTLAPAPPASESLPITFSAFSRHYAWVGDDDALRVAEIGGASRVLTALNTRNAVLGWSRDGAKLLVRDKIRKHQEGVAETIPFRSTLYPLSGGEAVALDDQTTDPYYSILPDGSGVYSFRQADGTPNSPALPEDSPLWLFVKPIGLPETREFETGSYAMGVWSTDSQRYAYFVHPDNDPLKGVDLRVYDRQTKSVETLFHVESDDLFGLSKTLAWDANERVLFSFVDGTDTDTSLVVTAIPILEPTAKISVLPITLAAGERVNQLRFSPDGESIGYEVLRNTSFTSENGSGTIGRSQGVFVAQINDGQARKVAPRGTFVSWLPGSHEVIVATGYGLEKRYYRIDVQETEETL